MLKSLLEKSLGTKVIVDKSREIYFIGNVKFHLDKVKDLGEFIEIEALSTDKSLTKSDLYKQCQSYLKLFSIEEKDLLPGSYSDLLLEKKVGLV